MIKGLFSVALAALAGFGLGLALIAVAGPAASQSHQSNTDCEISFRLCERDVEEQNPGSDPCSAYSRCQSAKMCGASRCICLRTHGSEDPALAQEAAAMCFGVLSPHGPNTCDRHVEACQDWFNAQHQKPDPPQGQTPPTPAHPQPGMPDVPLPPDQLTRFR